MCQTDISPAYTTARAASFVKRTSALTRCWTSDVSEFPKGQDTVSGTRALCVPRGLRTLIPVGQEIRTTLLTVVSSFTSMLDVQRYVSSGPAGRTAAMDTRQRIPRWPDAETPLRFGCFASRAWLWRRRNAEILQVREGTVAAPNQGVPGQMPW